VPPKNANPQTPHQQLKERAENFKKIIKEDVPNDKSYLGMFDHLDPKAVSQAKKRELEAKQREQEKKMEQDKRLKETFTSEKKKQIQEAPSVTDEMVQTRNYKNEVVVLNSENYSKMTKQIF